MSIVTAVVCWLSFAVGFVVGAWWRDAHEDTQGF